MTAIPVLAQAGTGLRTADQSRPAGRDTPAETQRLDQIIVRLTRRARKVAVVRLDKLYRTRGGAAPGSGEGDEGDDGDDDGGAA